MFLDAKKAPVCLQKGPQTTRLSMTLHKTNSQINVSPQNCSCLWHRSCKVADQVSFLGASSISPRANADIRCELWGDQIEVVATTSSLKIENHNYYTLTANDPKQFV